MNIFHKIKLASQTFIALCLSSCSLLLPDKPNSASVKTIPHYPPVEELHGKCVNVIDGDTFVLSTTDNKKVTIHLWGIDAPENNQNYGRKARVTLSNKLFEKDVRVTVLKKEKDGAITGKVYYSYKVPLVRDIKYRYAYVNKHMVENGYAWLDEQGTGKYDPELANALKHAQDNKTGLWGRFPYPTPPWEWRKGFYYDGEKLVKRTSSGKYWVSDEHIALLSRKQKTIHNSDCDYYGVIYHYDYKSICGTSEKRIATTSGYFTDTPEGQNCHLCGGARLPNQTYSAGSASTSTTSQTTSTSGNYWINSKSGETHNSSCRWYANTKEGYFSSSGSGNNCGICGGAGWSSSYTPSFYTPSYSPTGNRVHVRGYFRKDGTYVRPHTRKWPSR